MLSLQKLGLLSFERCFVTRECDLCRSKDAVVKAKKEGIVFFLKWSRTSVERVNDKEGCLLSLLEKGQALLTWLSGESQWQEASWAINPEGWGSVENGQPSQFSARLPFAFSFLFAPFVCMLVTVILFCSSNFPLSRCCSPLTAVLHSSRLRSLVSRDDSSDRLKLKLRPEG